MDIDQQKSKVYFLESSNHRDNITDWALERYGAASGGCQPPGETRKRTRKTPGRLHAPLAGRPDDDPECIGLLVGQDVRVSVETLRIVKSLPVKLSES